MKTLTKDNIILHGGELLIVSTHIISACPEITKNGIIEFKTFKYFNSNGNLREIIASTKQLEGVKQLDRALFIKPDVDVEELAKEVSLTAIISIQVMLCEKYGSKATTPIGKSLLLMI